MSHAAAPPMSKARRAAVMDYVQEIRRLLYLQHWRIDLPDEYPDDPDEAIAQIDPCDGRYVATLYLGPAFWYQSIERTRDAIVHELLHLHHTRVTNAVRLGEYRHQLGKGLYDQLNSEVDREAEYMVDALTSIVGEHVPSPEPWPE